MNKTDLVFRDFTRRHSPVPCRGLAVRALRAARPYLKVSPGKTAEVSVTVVGTARMRALNRRWRKVDKPTDVLSFPLPMRPIQGYTAISLGDIFVCPDVVRAKAKASGTAYRKQMKWTLVHGLLHLAGYDHEKGVTAAKKMNAAERRILKRMG